MEYDKAPTWKYIDFFKHLENDLKEDKEGVINERSNKF